MRPDRVAGENDVAHIGATGSGWGSPGLDQRPRKPSLLHFPSANSAAHRPSPRDVTRLDEVLDDDVWAFSNCRVDAPGYPVAEVDWFFYNVRHGTLMISEWKGFSQRVAVATDTGTRWQLEGGLLVPNPIEQVSRQLDAVRAVLRTAILPKHFPEFDPLAVRLMQSVYSPQVDGGTVIERIRWGKVYGNLADLASVISHASSPVPLLLPHDEARFGLAKALCALFRTTMPADVKAKLRVSKPHPGAAVVLRISEIHRQMAALHAELAELTAAAAVGTAGQPEPVPQSLPQPQPAKQPAPSVKTPKPAKATAAKPAAAKPAKPALTEQQRMQAHLARSFKGVNGSVDAAAKALEQAWAAVLNDPLLHGKTGISVGLFGSVGTPLVKDKHGSLSKVLGMQLRKWCVLQAEEAGMKPRDVAGQPSNIRVR